MRDGNEMTRFFKAYFIGSLIYAVWFGVLMYAVDPMFGTMGCDMQSGDYLCFQDGYPRPFTNFLYPSCPFRYSAFCTLPS